MNEHITADDREILDMLHDVVYKATNKEGDYDEWLLNKRKTMKALTDILVGLIVNTPSYTAPPKRELVGLTDDEIKEIIGPWGETPIKGYTRKLFDQIEAKLKEKNT